MEFMFSFFKSTFHLNRYADHINVHQIKCKLEAFSLVTADFWTPFSFTPLSPLISHSHCLFFAYLFFNSFIILCSSNFPSSTNHVVSYSELDKITFRGFDLKYISLNSFAPHSRAENGRDQIEQSSTESFITSMNNE